MRISLRKTLSQDSAVDLDDVFAVKSALLRTGHYKLPKYGMTPYPDKELFDAIRDFQESKNLKIDGVIKPNGPTITHLNAETEDDTDDEDPSNRAPILRCPHCGAPHGGSSGSLCPDCDAKS